jgi:hypothetical protein
VRFDKGEKNASPKSIAILALFFVISSKSRYIVSAKRMLDHAT